MAAVTQVRILVTACREKYFLSTQSIVVYFLFCYAKTIEGLKSVKKIVCGSGGIRTHAPEETGALNQRLRPLGHATLLVAHAKKMPRNCTDG